MNQPKNGKVRLYCFPYAGGNTSVYLPFKEKIGDEIELVAVQLPGRAERMFEEPFTDMDTLVETLYRQMAPTLHEPFAFLGYSMGGAIAYALTKKIESVSKFKPEFIIISATKPIELLNQGRKHTLSDEALINVLREHKASPKEVLDSKELMEILLPMIRADYTLIETYTSNEVPLLQIPLILFNSEEDMPKETILQWQNYFKDKANYIAFEGGHFFIHTQVDKMVEAIRKLLKK